jgi:hypothetical protein
MLENAISDKLVGKIIGLQKLSDYFNLVDFYRENDHQMREHDRRVSSRLRASCPAPSINQNENLKTNHWWNLQAGPALLAQHGRCYKCGEHGLICR